MTDLQGRFTTFGRDCVSYCRSVHQDTITKPLILQFVRASTSVGANYMEAQNCISRKDFRNKIYTCKKEAEEASYWLVILEPRSANLQVRWQQLCKEADEIKRILQAIANKLAPPTYTG